MNRFLAMQKLFYAELGRSANQIALPFFFFLGMIPLEAC
jgi:hypothetical protein